jgi:glycosyltransferase involved in cell wall biosynthesis
VRIAVIYDCLYPNTLGGAERWYRGLAEHLHGSHQVTYLTRRQWDDDAGLETPFPVVAVSPGGPLYTRSGRRRIWPTLRFGLGVFWHMLRHGRHYEAVHSASFPYFSLIGARLAVRLRRHRAWLLVDWHEVWSRAYWIDYLGPIGGRIGYAVQRVCISLPDHSFTFSRLHARRLVELGHRAPLTRLTGEYAGAVESPDPPEPPPRPGRIPLVVFAGRHIPEKRVSLIPEVIARAREELPELRCAIFGDGPERAAVEERVAALGLERIVELPGRAATEQVSRAIAGASCLLLPSLREGYGAVVVEALAAGTPAVVVAGTENAAADLITDGVNGFISPSPAPEAVAERVVAAINAGDRLRRSTSDWYAAHADELSIESSFRAVDSAYAEFGARSTTAS